jgi:predicted DNA-binding protein (UPF0251 family)
MPQARRGRGRGRGRRWITEIPETTHFIPHGKPEMEMKTIWLTYAELEAIRLVDLEGLHQDEAALEMGVSRKTLWNELKSARKKVATALIHGCAIRIEGGDYILRGELR